MKWLHTMIAAVSMAVMETKISRPKKARSKGMRYLFLVSLFEEQQKCFGDQERAQGVGEENFLELILIPATSTCIHASKRIPQALEI